MTVWETLVGQRVVADSLATAAGGHGMSQAWLLGQRALREGWRTPDALIPTLFIPLFFLVVNVGQAAEIFPSSTTGFLYGQGYDHNWALDREDNGAREGSDAQDPLEEARMAAMKPRTGDGPLEVTKEGRGIVMRVPLEGGGRLVVEMSAEEATALGDALKAAAG